MCALSFPENRSFDRVVCGGLVAYLPCDLQDVCFTELVLHSLDLGDVHGHFLKIINVGSTDIFLFELSQLRLE